MSFETNIKAAFQRAGNEAKALRSLINGNVADLAGLKTTAKNNLVAAINEVQDAVKQAAGGGATINDSAASSGSVFSSQEVVTRLQALKDDLLGPDVAAALDTFKEIGDAIGENGSAIAAINTALANRVRVDVAQGLTAAQQLQGRANLGAVASADVGDTSADFVATYEAALA